MLKRLSVTVVECEIISEGELTIPEGGESRSMALIREVKSGLEFTVPTGALASGQPLSSPFGTGTVIFAGAPRTGDYIAPDIMAGHYGITNSHPDYPLDMWQEAVAELETRSSYWVWVSQELKNALHDFFELD